MFVKAVVLAAAGFVGFHVLGLEWDGAGPFLLMPAAAAVVILMLGTA